MHRLILIASLIASLCTLGVAAQSAAVSIANEPHHKRLLYTNDLRLWDVTLAPGESTPPFLYDYDAATLVIGGGTVNTHHGGETARIENSGNAPYRALEIENVHEMKQTPPFTISDLMLKVSDGAAMHQHTGATMIVLVSGTLEQGGIGGEEPVRISRPGQWLVLPRFQAHTVAAVGGNMRALEIEVR